MAEKVTVTTEVDALEVFREFIEIADTDQIEKLISSIIEDLDTEEFFMAVQAIFSKKAQRFEARASHSQGEGKEWLEDEVRKHHMIAKNIGDILVDLEEAKG